MRNASRACYLTLLIGIIVLSWGFSRTNGLVYQVDNSGQLLYTRDLSSSGANDNLSIELGSVIFLAPLVFRIARWQRRAKPIEWMALSVCCLVQGGLMCSLDSGSILKTVLKDGNIILLLWLLAYLALLLSFAYFAKPEGDPVEDHRMDSNGKESPI